MASLTALPSFAWGAGLTLQATHPPQAVGADRFAFPSTHGPVTYEVLPRVVVHSRDAKPPHPAAQSLGGLSWRIPTDSPAAAVALALELSAQASFDSVFPDVRLPTERRTNDPHREGQWYLDSIEMDALHAYTWGDSQTRVAVIDSGIDHTHVDLIDRVDAPYDAFSDDSDPSPDPGEFCPGTSSAICDEHGTAVAGVIAATGDNAEGIIGMCPACTLIPIKMLGDGPGALSADVAAFEHALAEDAAVINNSWGFTSRTAVPAPLASVIERATTEGRDGLGAVVVFAAGNDNREIGDEELQALPGVVCVSAIDNYGYSTSYTNFGPPVDVAAPSATVSITPIDDFTTDFGGTSAAAPVVAGLAAWIISVDPSLTGAEVAQLIVDTATESPFVTHDANGHHDVYGYGIITPTAVLAALTTVADTADSGTPAGEPDVDETPDDAGEDKGGCSTTGTAATGAVPFGFWGLLWAIGFRRRGAPRESPR